MGIEIELRLAAGEPAVPDDYRARFPALAASITQLFDEAKASPNPRQGLAASARSATLERT